MTKTVMAEAFEKAGETSAADRLRDIALAVLEQYPNKTEAAKRALLDRLADNSPGWALHERDHDYRAGAYLNVLSNELRDQRKQNAGGEASFTVSKDHSGPASSAGSQNASGEAIAEVPQGQITVASSARSPSAERWGGGQRKIAHESQSASAPAKSYGNKPRSRGVTSFESQLASSAYMRCGYGNKTFADMTRSGLEHARDASGVLGRFADALLNEMPHDPNAVTRNWVTPVRSDEIFATVLGGERSRGLRLLEAS